MSGPEETDLSPEDEREVVHRVNNALFTVELFADQAIRRAEESPSEAGQQVIDEMNGIKGVIREVSALGADATDRKTPEIMERLGLEQKDSGRGID